MQLWFPSALMEPLSPGSALSSQRPLDPELEFDKEVYPIGISLSEVAIIGMPTFITPLLSLQVCGCLFDPEP